MCLVRCRGCRQMPVEQCPTGKLHNRPPPYLRVSRYRRQPLSLFSLIVHIVPKARPFRPRRGYVLDGPLYRVRLCACHRRRTARQPLPLPPNVSFVSYCFLFLFPYFIGSFTPSTTPARSTSAPFIITSLFTCQYSVHPARST